MGRECSRNSSRTLAGDAPVAGHGAEIRAGSLELVGSGTKGGARGLVGDRCGGAVGGAAARGFRRARGSSGGAPPSGGGVVRGVRAAGVVSPSGRPSGPADGGDGVL